jgi:ankyrin repeat protein
LDVAGVAPLHRAVRSRCAGAVRALLENGAGARLGNKSGSTPLHLAVQTTGRGGTGSAHARDEQQQIIRLLLLHGAHATDRDARGKTVEDRISSDWIREVLEKP